MSESTATNPSMKHVVAVILIMIGLVGCVAPIYYEKPLSSLKPLAERQRDAVECGALAGQTLMGYPNAIDPNALRLTVERTCLQSRGWHTAVPPASPSPMLQTPAVIAPVVPGCTTCQWAYLDGVISSAPCQLPYGEHVNGWVSNGSCAYRQLAP